MLCVVRNTLMQKLLCSIRYDSEYKIRHPFVPALSIFPRPPHIVHLRIKIYTLGIYRYSLRRVKARCFPLAHSSYSSKYSIKCSQRKNKINIMTWTALLVNYVVFFLTVGIQFPRHIPGEYQDIQSVRNWVRHNVPPGWVCVIFYTLYIQFY